MKTRHVLVLALLTALVAASCQRGAPEAPEQTPAEKPVRGGTLVVALPGDPQHFNVAITTAGEIHSAAELLYNGLIALDDKGNPVPDLAESLPKIEESGKVYRFTLRDGIKWHDGQPLTSADVKFSFEAALLKLHARTSSSVGPALEAIETPDARTVVFRFKKPYAPLMQQLDVTEAPIIPKHVYEDDAADLTKSPDNLQPVGSGPFKFVSYAKGSEIRYARNAEYFKKDLPYLDEVVIRIIPEPATQVASLEGGEVDWIPGVPGPDRSRLQANPDIKFLPTAWNPGGSNCIMTMSFNMKDRPMFQDLRVRQAIAHATNRQQFLDNILFGEGAVPAAPISSQIAWAHAGGLSMPKSDAAQAQKLLDEAGWKKEGEGARVARGVKGVPDGTKLAFEFLHFPAFSKYGELLKSQLAAVGIEVTQKPLDPAAFRPTVFIDRNFDTNIISYCNATDPEIGVRRMYTTENIRPVPFTNSSGYSNTDVDRLFDQASQEPDRAKRAQLYRQAQETIARDLPYWWVVETLSTRAYTSRCAGFKASTGLFAEEAYCKAK